MALDQEDPNDRAFRLVRCTGLFLFVFVYSRSSAALPVRTSSLPRAGGRRPRQRRITAPQRRGQCDGIIAAYQRSRRRRIIVQQDVAATVACPRIGDNDNGESAFRSIDNSDGSIYTPAATALKCSCAVRAGRDGSISACQLWGK